MLPGLLGTGPIGFVSKNAACLRTTKIGQTAGMSIAVHDQRGGNGSTNTATQQNTTNLRAVLARLAMNGCRAVVFTGSVFEPHEGKGDPECRAFSPYGLSKHMSFELFRLECRRVEIRLRKFVIPNPFGPYEELRFTSHAVRECQRCSSVRNESSTIRSSRWSAGRPAKLCSTSSLA